MAMKNLKRPAAAGFLFDLRSQRTVAHATAPECAAAAEGLNRALDVTTGCKQLRVRGTRAVEVSVSRKVTRWKFHP
jgi:hypothetical protein